MSLTITKADQPIPITSITLLEFGQPGVGKTSLAFTSERPLLLDFDGGAYRSEYRRDSVQVRTWDDIMGLTAEDLAPYATVVVDTVGRLLDALSVYIVQQNPKMGRGTGALTLQGYGELKSAYAGWLKTLLSYGKDVVLVAHDREEKDNDTIIVRPDIQGGSYGEVFKRADGIAYMYRGVKGTILDFNPSDKWVGKNAGGLPVLAVPHFSTTPDFLAGIILRIKHKLNAMTEHDEATKAEVEAWRVRFSVATTADALTAMVSEASRVGGTVGAQVKALLSERAKVLGVKWAAKEKRYVPADTKPA